jgi:photosystem II stability/assembly factor-like uncharacterized protein
VITRGLEIVRRHPTPVTGGVLLALVIALVVALNWAGGRSPSQSTIATKSRPITTMHFSSPDSGWVLSVGRLLVTRDGGRHWRDVTPGPLEPPIELSNVHFLDPMHGLAGTAVSAQTVQIFRTTDGGMTWGTSLLTVDQALGMSFDFVDTQHGWLVVATQTTTSGFVSAGQLFQTADGGVTWNALPPPPSGHAVRFMNLRTGLNVGGSSFDQLFITRDGGQSWQPQPVPIPTAYNQTAPALDLPAFVDSMLGVLPVMFADGSVQLEFSVDAGATWKIDPARAPLFVRQPPYARDEEVLAPSFLGNGVMAVVLGTEVRVHTGNTWVRVKPTGFDSVHQIEFVNPRVGWAVSSHLTCAGSGSASTCNSRQDLLRTLDGGRSWTAVPVS